MNRCPKQAAEVQKLFEGWRVSLIAMAAAQIERLAGCRAGKPAIGVNQQPEYVIDVEVSINENDLDILLKPLLENLPYPIELPIDSINGTFSITDIALTTVCESVNNEIRCTCDSQFTWNSTFCTKYQSCSANIIKDQTCDCIKDYPTEGTFCELKPITTTPTQSTAPTTTPTRTTTNAQTTPTTASKTTSTTATTPPNKLETQTFAIKLQNITYTDELSNSSSTLYKKFERDFKTQFETAYKDVRSDAIVNILGFTNGSINVVYDVTSKKALTSAEIEDSSKTVKDNLFRYAPEFIDSTEIPCYDSVYGVTNFNTIAEIPCDGNEGVMKKKCENNGKYGEILNFCISAAINDILQETKSTDFANNFSSLLEQLTNATAAAEENITSPGNVQAVVTILTTFSNVTVIVNKTDLENFLKTVSAVIASSSIETWRILTNTINNSLSSQLLQSVERFATRLSRNSDSFKIIEDNLHLNAIKIGPQSNNSSINVTFNNFTIMEYSNLTANILIAPEELKKAQNGIVITIAYPTWIDILPNNTNFDKSFLVNGLVVTIIFSVKEAVNIEMTFTPRNASLDFNTAKCVFWDFSDGGEWNERGCMSESIEGKNIKCNCEHLTSFSILMSSNTHKAIPLDYITKIGVAISIGSLLITITIEAIVWKYVTKNKTSYTRHVGILNIAVNLLVADIWFIVASGIKPGTDACTAATFFIHFFYLALFFWMLTLGLLLAYRVLFIFHDLSKSAMMGISFSIGYLAPLIISVITIGVTYPRNSYTREEACWLSWKEEYPLLAFIIPALTIIAINTIILIVVIYKMLRPTIGDRPRGHNQEKDTLKQIVRSIAVLTPILGLTWAFGIPTFQENSNITFHYIFTILNAFQQRFGFKGSGNSAAKGHKNCRIQQTVQSTSTAKPSSKPKYGFSAKKSKYDHETEHKWIQSHDKSYSKIYMNNCNLAVITEVKVGITYLTAAAFTGVPSRRLYAALQVGRDPNNDPVSQPGPLPTGSPLPRRTVTPPVDTDTKCPGADSSGATTFRC
uniref:adhesion G-protein coupled receptor F2-like n=1 Tax=Pristiophorus japonicus TaxID=55135 RepID=UPI00398F17DC